MSSTGNVIDVEHKAVKLRIDKMYKGSIEKEVLMKNDRVTTCDVLFHKEDKYLVYADEAKIDGKAVLETDVCAGTRRFADSKEDIKFIETPDPIPNLGELVPPKENKAQPKARRRRRKP